MDITSIALTITQYFTLENDKFVMQCKKCADTVGP